MKKVLILSRHDDRPTFDQKKTYEASLAKISARCDYAVEEFENLLFVYDGNELKVYLPDGKTDIASFDAVFLIAWFKTKILEDLALSVSVYLAAKGVKVVNSEALYTRSRSKLSQYVYAAVNGISLTPFLFSLNPSLLQRGFREHWTAGYPVIMKGVLASRGDDNHLVASRADALQLAGSMSEDGPWYVVQSFVPNDGDYRIIVMGDEVTAVIHRQSQTDSHLNNTSKGGEAALIAPEELPRHVAEQSVKLAKLLRREITGVDMIQHRGTGEYYLLEINNMPQLATGSFVPEKLALLDAYLDEL